MTAPQPNAALAYKVLDHIDADPASWDQRTWFERNPCGTVACFAGWTVMLAGHKVTPAKPDDESTILGWAAIDGDTNALISKVAARDLGIAELDGPCALGCPDCGFTDPVSKSLFAAPNTRERLGELVAEIFGPRPDGAA